MSYPFSLPTFGDYLRFAISQGCTVTSGLAQPGFVSFTLIRRGTRVLQVVGTKQGDYLVRTQVEAFDRRLGLQNPFFPF